MGYLFIATRMTIDVFFRKGQEDGVVSKMFTAQVLGPEFDPSPSPI